MSEGYPKPATKGLWVQKLKHWAVVPFIAVVTTITWIAARLRGSKNSESITRRREEKQRRKSLWKKDKNVPMKPAA